MRFLRPVIAALLVGASAPLAFVAPALAQTCQCPQAGLTSGPIIEADEPPPPLPDYDQPPMPAPGYYWTPGYWAWNTYDYYWVPGVWVEPPQPGLLWTPGYWAFVGGVFLFRQGYWGPHVGFYGGVNYGYGYNGLGYEGGRWDNGRFFYNSTVNNFGAVRATNVYAQPVTVPPGIGRASFNGGPGGILLKPTPEQERLTTETRVKPTQLQTNQAREASVKPEQFNTTNKGKPPVAATSRPGDFKGKDVVPARAAGTAQVAPANAPPLPPTAAPTQPVPPGQTPNGATKLQEKPPTGEKPIKTEPLNAPKALEKAPATPTQPVPPGQAPNGATKLQEKPPMGEKPIKTEPLNAPKALEKPPAVPAPPVAPTPNNGAMRPPGLEKPIRPELAPNAAQKALERPPGLEKQERRLPQPGSRPPLCGQPGLPPCPH